MSAQRQKPEPKPKPAAAAPSHEEIERRAYEIFSAPWRGAGRPDAGAGSKRSGSCARRPDMAPAGGRHAAAALR